MDRGLSVLRIVAAGLGLALAAAHAASPPQTDAKPADQGPIRLASHRAVYDLTLAGSGGTRSVESAQGRIVIDFSGDGCRGYTMQTRQVTSLASSESGDRISDLRNATFEAGNGTSFRFKSSSILNGQTAQSVDGTADATNDTLKVRLKEPKRDQFSEGSPVQFPSHHMRRLLQAAIAGDTTMSAKVFDGSDDGRKVYDTLAVIGRASAAPAATAKADRDKPLREGEIAGMRRWPVTLSYFTPGEGERMPIYTLTFDLYENGVSGALHIDYGAFSLLGDMTRLELRKPDKSESECAE